MRQRPLSITIIGCLFILAGSVGFAYHLSEFTDRRPIDLELIGICLIRVVAIVSGIFLLRGSDWARWLLAVWMTYHIVLSAFHSLSQTVTHIVLFGVIAFFLFRPLSSAYFRRPTPTATQ